MDENPSARYKQTGCTGQTGYTVHILDEIIDKSVRQIFSKMRGIPKEQIITRRYEREVVERKNHLQTIQVERDKAQKDLISLKTEILTCIKGGERPSQRNPCRDDYSAGGKTSGIGCSL